MTFAFGGQRSVYAASRGTVLSTNRKNRGVAGPGFELTRLTVGAWARANRSFGRRLRADRRTGLQGYWFRGSRTRIREASGWWAPHIGSRARRTAGIFVLWQTDGLQPMDEQGEGANLGA